MMATTEQMQNRLSKTQKQQRATKRKKIDRAKYIIGGMYFQSSEQLSKVLNENSEIYKYISSNEDNIKVLKEAAHFAFPNHYKLPEVAEQKKVYKIVSSEGKIHIFDDKDDIALARRYGATYNRKDGLYNVMSDSELDRIVRYVAEAKTKKREPIFNPKIKHLYIYNIDEYALIEMKREGAIYDANAQTYHAKDENHYKFLVAKLEQLRLRHKERLLAREKAKEKRKTERDTANFELIKLNDIEYRSKSNRVYLHDVRNIDPKIIKKQGGKYDEQEGQWHVSIQKIIEKLAVIYKGNTPQVVQHPDAPLQIEAQQEQNQLNQEQQLKIHRVAFVPDEKEQKIWIDGVDNKKHAAILHEAGAEMSDRNDMKRWYVTIGKDEVMNKVQTALLAELTQK